MKKWISSAVMALCLGMIVLSGCGAREESGEAPQITATQPEVSNALADDIVRALYESHLCYHSWNSYEEVPPSEIAQYAFCRLQLEGGVDNRLGSFYLEEDEFERYAQSHMDIPKDWMRQGFNWYHAETKEYVCDDMLGVPLMHQLSVLNIAVEENCVAIEYEIKDGNTILLHNTVFLTYSEGNWKLQNHQIQELDLVRICEDLNICGMDFDFEDATQLTQEQRLRFGMWVVDHDLLHYSQWCEWEAEGACFNVPVWVVQEALEKRLGAVGFCPETLPKYDPTTQTVKVHIGGYGGVRNPYLRSQTVEDGITTLIIEYRGMDETADTVYEVRKYCFAVDEDYHWQLLSSMPLS